MYRQVSLSRYSPKNTEQLGKLGGGRERKTRFPDLNFRGMEFYVKVIFCRVNEKISLEN